jgi:CheY-like chemotaxis protein
MEVPEMERKCLILYVDDHEDSALMFQTLLGYSNHEVLTAGSAEEALRMAREREFDLYILDKRLPDASGLELCKLLNEATPEIPVILYSGDAYQVARQKALAAGARACVTKPDIEGLIETINRLLSERECAAA